MKILVVNAGSSSLKYQLFDMSTNTVLAKGNCERIGIDGLITHKCPGKPDYQTHADFPTHKEAIKLVVQNLPLCYDDPNNIEARENMAYAEYMAGLAYSNSGLGVAHAIAHGVEGKYNIQHGLILAIVLCAALKFNMYSPAAPEYKYIAEAFGADTTGKTTEEICRLAIKEIDKFRSDFNIPKKLSDYGISESDLDIIALNAFEDVCNAANPKEATMTDIYTILKKLL